MSRKIIILNQVGETGDFRIAYWLDVPAPRQVFYVNANAASAVIGATQTEIDALKAGQVLELVERFDRPNSTTAAQLRAALVTRFTALQTALTNSNQWSRYGTFYDGATWTTVTVA